MKKLLLYVFTCLSIAAHGQSFVPVISFSSDEVISGGKMADLNGDGQNELIFAAGSNLLQYDSRSGFLDTLAYDLISTEIGIGDFDGDNKSELIIFTRRDSISGIYAYMSSDSAYTLLNKYDSVDHLSAHPNNEPLLLASGWRNDTQSQTIYTFKDEWVEQPLINPKGRVSNMLPFRMDSAYNILTLSAGEVFQQSPDSLYDSLIYSNVINLNRVAPRSFRKERLQISKPDKTVLAGDSVLELDVPAHLYQTVIADFTNDGIDDLLYLDSLQNLHLQPSVFIPGEFQSVDLNFSASHVSAGDWDLDGDLDIIISSVSSKSIEILQNEVEIRNYGPVPVSEHVSFTIGDKVIVAWKNTWDDHSATKDITYDVAIGSGTLTSNLLPSSFTMDSVSRMQWEWGNAGHANSIEIEVGNLGNLWYGIQSIDNTRIALTSWKDCDPSYPQPETQVCGDLPIACGNIQICEQQGFTILPFCNDENVELRESYDAGWYSSRSGYLGISSYISTVVEDQDTIYSVPLGGSSQSCDDQKAYVFRFSPESTTITYDLCEGEVVTVPSAPQADSTQWFSNDTLLQSGSALNFTADSTTQILAVSFYGECTKTDSVLLNVVKPLVVITPSESTIMLGEDLVLTASGADEYSWSPESAIDENLGAEIVVSPDQDMEYYVVGTDTLGCTGESSAQVKVINQAFIPNLFTPNGDTSNDVLLIYGLQPTTSFEFIIYSRNGSVVFRATSSEQMLNRGWDGTENGRSLPDGTYYWKVAGSFDDGSEVLLNGRQEGVVHLMR